ncbi:hypothetical protein GTA08_BOTSDO10030 [Neofusicoccum parvum]|nr:hypothetical protein GTA08_BOTSDO10030 [Neofusicoccum parvum]
MATMAAATVAQAQQPLPTPAPLFTPPREPPPHTRTFSAYLASFSTPSTSSLSDYSSPSSVEAATDEEEEDNDDAPTAATTNPSLNSPNPLPSPPPIALPTPSIAIQPSSSTTTTTPSNAPAPSPSLPETQAEAAPPAVEPRYPPLNVLDRIRILEEAREEQMRILRATGAVPDATMTAAATAARRFSVGGAREQISGLEEPWW